jgi:3-oxoadipate enol-lactonase
MKTFVLFFSILFITASNLLPQEYNNDSTMKIDSDYINVDGGKLFYETAGEGENIVLLHDGAVHREVWNAQFPVFAKTYRVARYDRRGYGKSLNPKAPYSNIEDLNQLFIQLKIDKAVIMGISSGGGLAIDFTLKYPEKVSGLVLVGAVVSGYGYTTHMLTRGGRINSFTELIAEPQKLMEYLGKEDPYEVYAKNIKAKERFLKLLKANPINVNQEKGKYLKPPDRPAANFLSEIKVPVLVLVGEYDIPDVHAHAGVIEYGIPNAKREIISNCGHLIPLEQPEVFNTSVLHFLKNIEFYNVLNSQGVDAAAKYFHNRHEREPGIVLFDENEMNSLGYSFLQKGEIRDAIEVFKLNVIAYPKSWNVYDSLGEAFLKDGQKELAIENYEKSLELNPNNTNAKEVLKNLE